MSKQWQIEFYREPDGTEPVREFLQDPSLRPGELKQLQVRLQLLADRGLALMIQRADILDKIVTEDNLYELRIDNTPNNPRFFLCALFGKRLILLHAFKKKSKKTPRRDIQLAAKRRDLIIAMEKDKGK